VLVFTCIGLGLAATALFNLLARGADIYLFYRYAADRGWDTGSIFGRQAVGQILRDVVFAVGGLFISFGARGLSRLINRVRGYSWDDA
jgi:hypothetical protein